MDIYYNYMKMTLFEYNLYFQQSIINIILKIKSLHVHKTWCNKNKLLTLLIKWNSLHFLYCSIVIDTDYWALNLRIYGLLRIFLWSRYMVNTSNFLFIFIFVLNKTVCNLCMIRKARYPSLIYNDRISPIKLKVLTQ